MTGVSPPRFVAVALVASPDQPAKMIGLRRIRHGRFSCREVEGLYLASPTQHGWNKLTAGQRGALAHYRFDRRSRTVWRSKRAHDGAWSILLGMTRRPAVGLARARRPFDDQGSQRVDRLLVLFSSHRHRLDALDHVVLRMVSGAGIGIHTVDRAPSTQHRPEVAPLIHSREVIFSPPRQVWWRFALRLAATVCSREASGRAIAAFGDLACC